MLLLLSSEVSPPTFSISSRHFLLAFFFAIYIDTCIDIKKEEEEEMGRQSSGRGV